MGRYFVFFVAQKMNYFRSVVRDMVPKVVTCTQSSNTSYSPHKINFKFVLNIFFFALKKGTNWTSRRCNVKMATREMEWPCDQDFLNLLTTFPSPLWLHSKQNFDIKVNWGKPVKSVKWSKKQQFEGFSSISHTGDKCQFLGQKPNFDEKPKIVFFTVNFDSCWRWEYQKVKIFKF